MSPKKTPRGGRYTKRVNRDGSQQYGRRGCMIMMVGAFIALGPVVGVLGFWIGVAAR